MRVILNFEHRCNLKCSWCYVPFVRAKPDFVVTNRVLARLHEYGISKITIGGGDPTLYHEWRDLVANAKMAGLFVHLDTNGIGLRHCESDKTALLSYVDLLGLPIDGPDSSTHGLIRQHPKHFEIVIDRMSWLRELGVAIKINTIVTKKNFSLLEDMSELIRALAPSIWSVYEYWPLSVGGANREQWDEPSGGLAAAIAGLPRYVGKTRIEKNLRHARRLTYPIVAHDGEIYIHSASDIDQLQPLGSIFECGVLERAFASCTEERAEAQSRYTP
ncbi:radical SAM protein [Mesorhizobium sp. ESP6-5]|uniref:radical SAM protein n=1 Tax=Mesorhizobium sp. ESP6-5 TaxID=2876623 RepID=UPI001CCF0DE4|nr:radical SAM protein [Mesorhizobium sp. ESP6-5]MBZ9757004.1 radical SAM protein [Mesorhizobium sp. ESP6-5]